VLDFLENHWFILNLFTASFIITLLFSYLFRAYVSRINISIAEPNHRSSHKNPTPTGGGLIIALVYIASLILMIYYLETDSYNSIIYIIFGGLITTLFGFYDDINDISAKAKLALQVFLGVWILYIFGKEIFDYFEPYMHSLTWPFILFSWFLLVWFSNAINFMDGIDGMLTSGVILISLTASLLIILTQGFNDNVIFLLLLIPVCIAFLMFNYPPASIFMGDSGSLFFGYILACLVIKTIVDGHLSFWTWSILFGHLFTEPTVTTMLRIKLSKNWYKPHRSNAYQNLARVLDDHKKVTIISIILHIFWLLPLSLVSIYRNDFGFFIYLIAIIPVIGFTFKYGPLYSNR